MTWATRGGSSSSSAPGGSATAATASSARCSAMKSSASGNTRIRKFLFLLPSATTTAIQLHDTAEIKQTTTSSMVHSKLAAAALKEKEIQRGKRKERLSKAAVSLHQHHQSGGATSTKETSSSAAAIYSKHASSAGGKTKKGEKQTKMFFTFIGDPNPFDQDDQLFPKACYPEITEAAVRCCKANKNETDKVMMEDLRDLSGRRGGNDDKFCNGQGEWVDGTQVADLKGLTQAEAMQICSNAGARLCDFEELRADKTAGTGCQFDDHNIWSNTECYEEGVYVNNWLTIEEIRLSDPRFMNDANKNVMMAAAFNWTYPLTAEAEKCTKGWNPTPESLNETHYGIMWDRLARVSRVELFAQSSEGAAFTTTTKIIGLKRDEDGTQTEIFSFDNIQTVTPDGISIYLDTKPHELVNTLKLIKKCSDRQPCFELCGLRVAVERAWRMWPGDPGMLDR
ncbi:unnamed protein product [Amoebophrya sp. A120]|nr:unnamed protein product [Amoebophrya sp. A120]|eukprot:GSA120T00009272001.1